MDTEMSQSQWHDPDSETSDDSPERDPEESESRCEASVCATVAGG